MHEFFGAAAVLDKAEQAQLRAAGHVLTAFGISRPPAMSTSSASAHVGAESRSDDAAWPQ
jgi:acetyl esterase